jgi:carbamate kinase
MTSAEGSIRPQDQIEAVGRAMEPVAELVAAGHEVVLTHGNGPQVGNLLVKNELAAAVVPPVPLDWCDAQTQGSIGFVITCALERSLARRGIRRPAAVLVSRTLVDPADPGFAAPTKPIGRYLPRDQAQPLIKHGQTWQDRGALGWRRVVASPEPVEVLDAEAALALVDAGYVVVAGGGGGVPCVRDADGGVHGVEAVVDKDLAAVLLGRALGVDVLVIATDVEYVAVGWGTPTQRDLGEVDVGELRELALAGEFASGSMGPKVEAVCRFVEQGGRHAAICTLSRIADAVAGRAGTVVRTKTGPDHPA